MLYPFNVAGNDTWRYHDNVAWLYCWRKTLYKIEACKLKRLQMPGNSFQFYWSVAYGLHIRLWFGFSDLKIGSVYLNIILLVGQSVPLGILEGEEWTFCTTWTQVAAIHVFFSLVKILIDNYQMHLAIKRENNAWSSKGGKSSQAL